METHRLEHPDGRTTTAPCTAAYMTQFQAVANGNAILAMAAKIVTLGTIDMNAGTFTAGSTMPTNVIEGVSVQTASMIPIRAETCGTPDFV